jgi:aspartate oxidase
MEPSSDPPDEVVRAADRQARAAARRRRQLIEIAGLVVTDALERARGLALHHTTEFPDDADLLSHITRDPTSRRNDNAGQRTA